MSARAKNERQRDVTALFAGRATLARSLRLLGEFRFEQSDPARFYGALADDTVALVTSLWTAAHGSGPAGRTLLDVGGGPGYFAAAFADAGLDYVGVEPDPTEMHAGPAGERGSGAFVRASGMALPFADDSVDICLSSNVAEHVRDPWRLGREQLRVTRPGGLVVLSYTVWLGPFGGHEMGMTHYLGGRRAADSVTIGVAGGEDCRPILPAYRNFHSLQVVIALQPKREGESCLWSWESMSARRASRP